MARRRFFDRPAGLAVAEIVSLTGAQCDDGARLSHLIADVAPIDLAGPSDLTFIESNKYADALATTHAGACLMPQRFEGRMPDTLIALRTNEPHRAFVAVHRRFYPQSLRPTSLFELSDIAPGATIHPDARLESGITVDPGAVIGPRAEIGAGSMIGATAVIGPDVMIGRDCVIAAASATP
jgi:UDP-3-O-[3-hydroxymyristoyl] glucosamine N-acyltransferase